MRWYVKSKIMKQVKQISLLAVFFFTVFLSGAAYAGEQSITKIVEITGTSVVCNKDVVKARNQAISNSLISAVEMVVSDFLSTESLVRNFQILNEALYDNTGKFIQNYKVLTELISGKTYRVMVQATVSIDMVKQHLLSVGIRLVKKSLPKILFFIAEQNIEDASPQCWWGEDMTLTKTVTENAMSENMRKKGFTVIDHENILRNLRLDILSYKSDLDNEQAVNLGTRLQADVVIIGKSVADIAPNTMGENIRSFQGTVTVCALRTDTGAEIASTMQSAVAVNTDEVAGSIKALSHAGFLAGEELASQIAGVWRKAVKMPTVVEIIVEGTVQLANFVTFRNNLNDMAGVNGMQIKEMKFDESAIIVNFQGNAEELADALMLKAFDSFGINIYEVSQNHLRIKLIPIKILH